MLALLLASIAAPPTLLAAQSSISLLPPEPLPLGGYTARAGKLMETGGEDLFARTLLLQEGDLKIAIVSVEMLTLPESLVREVRAKLPTDVKLFMAATHTHSAPDSQMLNERMTFAIPGIATYKRKWLDRYSDRIANCVKKALAVRPFAVTPRVISHEVDLNRGRREGAVPDKTATLVQAGSGVNLFFHFAAHGTLLDEKHLQTSGDWPGAAASLFEAPILIGPIGDVSPAADAATGAEKVKKFVEGLKSAFPAPLSKDAEIWNLQRSGTTGAAEVVARSVRAGNYAVSPCSLRSGELTIASAQRVAASFRLRDSLGGATQAGTPPQVSGTPIPYPFPLFFLTHPIPLATKTPHPEFATANKIPQPIAKNLVGKFAPDEAQITVIRMDKIVIVGIPGEPTSHLGNKIKAAGLKLGFEHVLVVSHVNGWMGYILDAKDYDKGGYEATLSFYGKDQGDKVTEAAIEALTKLQKAS